MPVKTKAKKTPKPRVQSTQLKKTRIKPWHVLVAIALFIIGGFVVAYSRASSDSAAIKAELPLIQYEEGSGTSTVEMVNNVPVLKRGPKSIQVTQAGDLYCYEVDTDAGVTRSLSQGELSSLLQAIKNSGIGQIPVNTTPTVNVKMIRYIDKTTGEVVSVDLGNTPSDNPAYSKAVAALNGACKNQGNPTKRQDEPKMRTKTQRTSSTQLNPVYSNIVGVARAGETVAWLDRFNLVMATNIQNFRRQNGLGELLLDGCLKTTATNWSSTMASWYNSNPAYKMANKSQLIVHSNLLSTVAPYCKPWTSLGENIGWYWAKGSGWSADASANAMFNEYANSPGHRGQMLTTTMPYFNVGSALSSDEKLVWNTQHYRQP